jgi:FdhD protein
MHWHAGPVSRVTVRTPVRRFQNGVFVSRPDTVAGEEPLEIRVAGQSISTTMRTPGHDIELVHGLLHSEGIIAGREDVIAARYCAGVDSAGQNTYNVLDVSLTDPAAAQAVIVPRAFVTSSACGVCGTSSIEALQRTTRYVLQDFPIYDPEMITALPDQLRANQQVFRSTGGIHAAALVRPDGTIERVREDVGRHNAMDKVIGSALLADELPIADRALLTSSRASFELVQKAVMAGVGMLIAVSAPSSLAVQLATATGLTLVGFTSTKGFNIYSGAQRIAGAKI